MTTVAIHQPNYLPWLGYFRKIAQSDIFVFYDNVQMPMGKSLVTRNRLKSPQGVKWLTVPTTKSGTPELIRDTPVVAGNWTGKHLGSIRNWYAGSPCLDPVCDLLEASFGSATNIAELNIALVEGICAVAGMRDTSFVVASQMAHGLTGSDSILPILEELGADCYLTGQGAGSMRYLDVDSMSSLGIETRFLSNEFAHYPQRHGTFEDGLSALDALLCAGPDAFRDLLAD